MLAIVAAALLVAIAVFWLAGRVSGGDPKKLISAAKNYGMQAIGAAMLAFSAFSAARGNLAVGMVFVPIGLGLLKIIPVNANWFGMGAGKIGGQRSSVRSAFLEMTFDHATGTLDGTIVKGAYTGRPLQSLTQEQLVLLRRDVAVDSDSLALLEAYLDRRFAGWREHVEQDTGPGQRRASPSQAMREEEAYQILGLQPGAGQDDIRAAHRSLMKRLHPDIGGSTWLAAKVNEAKDLLLKTHR